MHTSTGGDHHVYTRPRVNHASFGLPHKGDVLYIPISIPSNIICVKQGGAIFELVNRDDALGPGHRGAEIAVRVVRPVLLYPNPCHLTRHAREDLRSSWRLLPCAAQVCTARRERPKRPPKPRGAQANKASPHVGPQTVTGGVREREGEGEGGKGRYA